MPGIHFEDAVEEDRGCRPSLIGYRTYGVPAVHTNHATPVRTWFPQPVRELR